MKTLYEQISEKEGYSVTELKRGYTVFNEGLVTVIQKIDCLDAYGMKRFINDTDAGKQALKDGYKLFTIEHEEYDGWYILDTPENRKVLTENGYM
ncbi:hypothetical protein NSQ93_22540 [Bacillus sp. FSL W8-0445]|uniref:hypothetical protein n=1 Tax=Bacillus TaxID=1386 RepID=UPI000779D501|nr:hypothetical protein [Bacillus licheniformis]KYC77045.1 hypothetical protein B4092_4782 [Bacillus licheniformis]TWN76607.1 hypothetical protein CHCC20494_0670 [Bacillus licheniformis]